MAILKKFNPKAAALALPLALGACATTVVERSVQTITPECDIETTSTRTVNGKLKEQRTFTDPNNPFNARCGGEREIAAAQLANAEVHATKVRAAYEILLIATRSELANNSNGIINSKKYLALIDSTIPEIALAAKETLAKKEFTEDDLRRHVALAEIDHNIANISNEDDTLNLISTAALLDAYDGKTYPLIDPSFIKSAINQKLTGNAGTTITALRSEFQQETMTNVSCQQTADNTWTCGTAAPSGVE